MAAGVCRRCGFCLTAPFKRHLWPTVLIKAAPYAARASVYQPNPERLAQIQESPSGWVPPTVPPPSLPFRVKRSWMNNLPVYTDIKRGGNLKITLIRKIDGDLRELQKCLRLHLGKDLDCQINELTSQIKIKGDHQEPVQKLLKSLGF